MDHSRFDRITRALSGHGDRRRLLTHGGALAALFGVSTLNADAKNKDNGKGKGKGGGGKHCKKKGKKRCDGHCYNLQTNRKHCGACGNECDSGQPCKDGVCGSTPPPATCGDSVPCTIFVSSTTTNGGFGALANADQMCQDAADAASLPGIYMAWISNETESAQDRLYHSTGSYVLPDGTTVVANDWDALTDSGTTALLNQIDQDESGTTVSGYAWTSTLADGTTFGTVNTTCNNWTSTVSDPSIKAVYGWLSATNASWTDGTYGDCNQTQRLYCIQQPLS